jgi:hypothetical protein
MDQTNSCMVLDIPSFVGTPNNRDAPEDGLEDLYQDDKSSKCEESIRGAVDKTDGNSDAENRSEYHSLSNLL